jgi:hypothetical protein
MPLDAQQSPPAAGTSSAVASVVVALTAADVVAPAMMPT